MASAPPSKPASESTSSSSPNASPPHGRAARVATLLAVGDAIAFLLFAFIGRRSHGETAGLHSILQVVSTAFPFWLGWIAVGLPTGMYRQGALGTVRTTIKRTAIAWGLAWPLALIIRGIANHEIPPISFALVTLITNGLILSMWRSIAARLA